MPRSGRTPGTAKRRSRRLLAALLSSPEQKLASREGAGGEHHTEETQPSILLRVSDGAITGGDRPEEELPPGIP